MKILPEKEHSYVVDSNGEPMIVFYRETSRLFVNRRLEKDHVGYFLNIRHPLHIDVTGQTQVLIPRIPDQCDGIILTGYGIHDSIAFIVKDKELQSMEFPLE
jgi:hypothetical protein